MKICEKAKEVAGTAYVMAVFGGLGVIEWACKRIRGDKSPVMVIPFIRVGGPRGW